MRLSIGLEAYPFVEADNVQENPLSARGGGVSIQQDSPRDASLQNHRQDRRRGMLAGVVNAVEGFYHARRAALVFAPMRVPIVGGKIATGDSQAQCAYPLFRTDPLHPSLRFKEVDEESNVDSVRIGLG